MRSIVASCGVVLALCGCSSGSAAPDDVRPSPSSIPADEPGAAESGESATPTTEVDEAAAASAYQVIIDVSVDRLGLSERFDVAIDPAELDEIDPFTRFSSCSGLRASIGTFTVTAVDASAAVNSVSVVTADRVDGSGIYDADVRVELDGEDPVTAVGTLTLDQSSRAGSFHAFEATGERVAGTFVCDGPPGTPVPIVDPAADDGVLRAVEVVALLRQGSEERIVGLTLDTAEVEAAAAECRGATDDEGGALVRVDGGQAVGAINSFELVPEQSPGMRMRVGGASYEVDDVEITVDERGASGSFSGTTVDGIAVDGAFRCA